jgi:hypothetical protein
MTYLNELWNSADLMVQMLASYESNRPEIYRLELDVVKDYEFEIEFTHLKNLSELKIHTKSYDGFYYQKRTSRQLPLTQITSLSLGGINNIDNDTFSNLTNINSLEVRTGNNTKHT